MIYLLILVGVVVLRVAFDKYLAMRVRTPRYVDVVGRSLTEIVEIGTKASGSLVRRTLGRPVAGQVAGGGASWDVPSRGSVMTFQVLPSPEGTGFRVSGEVTVVRLAQRRDQNPNARYGALSIWGRSVRVTNAIYGALGIPHKPTRMLRLRRRVLNAVSAAA